MFSLERALSFPANRTVGVSSVILHSSKVLIISDDEKRAAAVESLLRETECDVLLAPDVLSAMAIIKAESVDIVLLDDNPREFFICDAVRILKCFQYTGFLPVLCLFGEAGAAERRAQVLDAGADDCLTGCLEAVELQARIRKMLSVRALHQEFSHSKAQLEGALARESQLLRQLRTDNRELRQRSITDGLTSLYNHRYLMEWLKTEFKIARRYGHPISFVMADLDHFKQVNDQYGHPFGDFVLKEVAVLACKSVRDSDLVARYGGEEFAVVLPRGDQTMALRFAQRFHKAVGGHVFASAGHNVKVTVSLGLATYPSDAEITSPEMLVYLADQALLQAKASGRNAVVAWHQMTLQQRAMIRRKLSGETQAAEATGGRLAVLD
jgi:diguanylate cyclase (GGDEF)-like protein